MAISPLHGLGEDEGPATEFEWKWQWNVIPLLPWLLLLPLLLMQPNRNRRAWAVLIPVAVLAVPFYTFPPLRNFGDGNFDGIVFGALGLAAVCLLSHRLAALGGVRALFNAGALFLVVGIGASAFGDGLSFSQGFGPALVFNLVGHLVACAVVFMAMLLAAIACRKRYGYSRTRFTIVFCGALVAMSVLVTMTYMLIAILSMLAAGQPVANQMVSLDFMIAVLAATAALAGILLAFTTPFLALTMRNGLYEGRLRACCHFPADVVEEEPSEAL